MKDAFALLSEGFDSLAKSFAVAVVLLVIFIPLGVWKAVDLIVAAWQHFY